MGSRYMARAITAALAVALTVAAGACSSSVSTDSSSTTDGSPSGSAAGTTPGTADGATTGGTTPTSATGAAQPSPGCAGSTGTTPSVDAERRTLDVDGVERFYLLTTPEAEASTPLPLVLDLHGLAEGAQVHTSMSDFGTLAKSEGFVVAFPNGTGEPVRWDANPASDPNQDLAYFDQLLERLEADLCIDTSRVYVTGLSYGAIMTSFLTCERADDFAAVAPVAGITVPESGCAPSRPMPVITFHGTADPILKFNGGVDLGAISGGDGATTTTVPADLSGPGYPAAVQAWAERNGCDPTPTDTDIGPDVVHRVYDCPPDAAVELYIVVGGGHAWPGSAFSASIENVVGPTTTTIVATDLIWQFFQRFQLP